MTQSTSTCPFCNADELTPCTCFSSVKSSGKIKQECEWCGG